MQDDVIARLTSDHVKDLLLIVNYGFDGSSGQSQCKQKIQDENASDCSILLISLVPLCLTSGNQDVLVWQNPKPSSPRFCSPIKVNYTW